MSVSATDPIEKSFKRMSEILFKPFEIGKWFVLGFTAWLAVLGEGGGGNFNVPSGGGGPGGADPFESFLKWIESNLELAITIAVVVFLGVVTIGLVLTWIRSRGKFMFIHNIALNRAEVVAPWREYRAEGNSLFIFTILITIAGLIAYLVIGLIALAIAWIDIEARQFNTAAALALAVGIPLFLATVLVFVVITFMMEHFMIPVMYIHRVPAGQAWSIMWGKIVRPNKGSVALFFLLNIVWGFATAMLAMLVTCLTCCIAALPYLNAVALLPAFVFIRCYSLYFVEQLGPEWSIFKYDNVCPNCRYDLRGTPGADQCPECGADLQRERGDGGQNVVPL